MHRVCIFFNFQSYFIIVDHPTSTISSVNNDDDNVFILIHYDKVFPVPICQASYGVGLTK